MSRRISSLGILGVVALVALFAIAPAVGAAPRAADAKTVSMKDLKFDPQTITINVGDTITWQNGDQTEHTATADDGSFNTDDVEAGATSKVITFNTAGTFAYYCKYHGGPGGKGMSGTIVVQAAAAAQPTAAAPQPTAAPAQGSTPTGSIAVSDQAVKDGAITISKASISQDGWIVVHKAGPDGKLLLTPVIGQVQIKAGDSSNVAIKLTEAVAVGAPLWPMVHIDEGQKGVYEFPNGPDVPVVANGAPVMQEIKVTAAGAPAQLPRTGGEDAPIGLVLSALALLVAGALLTRRMRRA